ncbi:glycoside hydrolase family 26 protein [Algibacter pectinivorans]|uniref:Mannan endo-1,4-beta-mannosidase n=1 Tax=Algibacter pectinivorans TaxID=870482 RepID=A0A1I1QDU5_9FLAO|nr:glycosyl hydrolase [Algibacter pectinivorans]SFD20271.1 mannan endo-1,4-beta-mannosidase [Algibacter pectinivorans]
MKKLFLLFTISIISGCSRPNDLLDINATRNPPKLITPNNFADPNLNQEAKELYNKLLVLTQRGIMFGQQQPFGTGNNFPVSNKLEEDFFEVAGNHPAIAGFDLELISLQPDTRFSGPSLLDDFINQFVTKVVEAHENGSIITISWHFVNPNDFNFDGTSNLNNVVSKMLENGEYRELFIDRLERVSRLLNSLVDSNGSPIPVLFRPWHEMNGNFFFWGEGFRTTAEYKELWKDTIKILSEDFNVHNLLYVYAPNIVTSTSEYLRNYPGDQYVDMLGIDVYDFRNGNFLSSIRRNLKIVENIATDKNMLFALTETGLRNVVEHDWWTQSLYKAIRSSSITYTMVWRNDMTTFFHVPFIGHPSQDNFNTFINNETILLSNDIL